MKLTDLPALDALLNSTSAALLIAGYISIKLRRVKLHAACMIAAVVTSAGFLCGYLTYHAQMPEQSTRNMPYLPHWLRYLYLAILFPHLVLAIVMLPMIFLSLQRACRRQWQRHMRIAIPTFWIWLYVSATGVIIYWMLYHLFPTYRT